MGAVSTKEKEEIIMPFYNCKLSENNLEPLKHISIPVGGFHFEANGTAVSAPNNIKNVFPRNYKDMAASDFEVSADLGSGVYGNTSTSKGYTTVSVSNVAYDKETGTLTASTSISRTGGSVSQIFQKASARWKGTINGTEV